MSRKSERTPGDIGTLLRVLGEQRRALMIAGCDDIVLQQYQALIRFLQSAQPDDLQGIFGDASTPRHERRADEPNEKEVTDLSDAEIERLVSDDTTPRKTLEKIAIHRFRVPRGSMRSFSNREMLTEKLWTLLRNEQAHRAIETVARNQGELPGMRRKR